MIYLDTNALAPAVVYSEARTGPMERLMAKHRRDVFWWSPLADYELRKYLWSVPEELWAEDLPLALGRVTRLSTGWEAAVEQALKLAHDFRGRLAVDSADVLHVGWALSLKAELFASFDRASGPRALALCCGLTVWPDPTSEDYAAMNRLKTPAR